MKTLICNQKMYLTKDESENLRKAYDNIDFNGIELVVCPSYVNFDIFKGYVLGAQNCFYEDRGAYTGEVSAYDLSLRGIKYSIIGHSERRKYDTDEIINLKVKACLKHAITPIICIGETRLENEMRKTSEVLKRQITKALDNISLDKLDEIIIAYEPVHKIGTGSSLKKEEIEDTATYIRKVLEELKIDNYKLLYGGSVSKDNIEDISTEMIDGYLLGGASVKEEELKNIVKCIK